MANGKWQMSQFRLWSLVLRPWLLFLAVLVFYVYTLAPSLNWADGARLQMDMVLAGSTYWHFDEARHIPTDGLPFDRLGVAAWDHPLYVMLAQLFLALPGGDPLFRLNLISALAAAVAITLLYRLGLLLVGNSWAAALGAVALAVSHTFWFHAVTTEVYTLHTVFMVALIWLALRWPRYRQRRDLMLFALVAGLGLANHVMLVLTILPSAGYMLAAARTGTAPDAAALRAGVRPALAPAGFFLLGFAPWWIQFLRMARIIGVPLTFELAVALPWLPRRLVVRSWAEAGTNLLGYGGWLLYQFSPIGVALGLYGLIHLRRTRPRVANYLAALFLLHVAFSANYHVADRFTFHLPSYVVFALLLMAGLAGLRLPPARTALRFGWRAALLAAILAPMAIYPLAPAALRAVGLTEARLGIQPIGTGARDTLAYFLDPNHRGEDSAERFGRSTLAQLAPEALVFTSKPGDLEAYVVLRYLQVAEAQRPDVYLELMLFEPSDELPQAVLGVVRTQAPCRPIYLASLSPKMYPVDQIRADFELVPEANLFRLHPRRPLPPAGGCLDPAQRRTGASLEELIWSAMQ